MLFSCLFARRVSFAHITHIMLTPSFYVVCAVNTEAGCCARRQRLYNLVVGVLYFARGAGLKDELQTATQVAVGVPTEGDGGG